MPGSSIVCCPGEGVGRARDPAALNGQVPDIGDDPVTLALRRLCRGVVDELWLLGATVTVMTPDGSEAPAAASDDDIRVVEELQFAHGEGPSTDAFRSGRPVLVPDLAATDGRWVGFSASALEANVGAVYAFPLQVGAVRLGVLTYYSQVGRALESHEVSRCLVIAESATDVLMAGAAHEVGDDNLTQRALQIRTEVYQAQGFLKVGLGVSLSEALVRLRALAYAEGVDLNEFATDIVAGRRPLTDFNDPHDFNHGVEGA